MKSEYPKGWIIDLELESFDGRYAILKGGVKRKRINIQLDTLNYPQIRTWYPGYSYQMKIRLQNRVVPDVSGQLEEKDLDIWEVEESLLQDSKGVTRNIATFTLDELEGIVLEKVPPRRR